MPQPLLALGPHPQLQGHDQNLLPSLAVTLTKADREDSPPKPRFHPAATTQLCSLGPCS